MIYMANLSFKYKYIMYNNVLQVQVEYLKTIQLI